MSSSDDHSSAYTGFLQTPPQLHNPFTSDRLLHRVLTCHLGPSLLATLSPEFTALAEEAISPKVLDYFDDTNRNLPSVIHWDGWGRRKDELVTAEGWKQLKGFWARSGLMDDIHSRKYADKSRIVGFTKSSPTFSSPFQFYLIAASLGGTTCPLAMTDGATRCLELHAPKHIQEQVIPRLITRDPERQWTSGQWMTERTGGSDISGCETKAYPSQDASPQTFQSTSSTSSTSSTQSTTSFSPPTYTIKGFKWFSSATDSHITLLLAKTPQSPKVSLFYVRVKNDDGTLNGLRMIRLKDKFGTKSIPTAELELTGMQGAVMIGREGEGVKTVSEVLNITRIHCALGCLTNMRRGYSIVIDYAKKRKVFGKFLSQNGLHLRTLTNLSVQLRWTTHFVFFIISLLGKTESSSSPSPSLSTNPSLSTSPSPSESFSPSTSLSDAGLLLRLLTPVLKVTLAKTGIAFLSECMESLGGQGYVEEGGIGVLYRDTQVNAIWEGTTNVLADDMLRVLRGRSSTATWDALDGYISRNIENAEKVVRSGSCRKLGTFPRRLRGVYERWRGGMMRDEGVVRIHGREMVLLLGRIVGAVEMMGDAMRDGDEIEMECCERIFEFEKQGWDIDAVTSLKMDQRIVFGEEVAGTGTVQAKL